MPSIIEVSPEMLTVLGAAAFPADRLPPESVAIAFSGLAPGRIPTVEYVGSPVAAGIPDADLVFYVARSACERLFATRPDRAMTWHLPCGLAAIARSIVDCEGDCAARDTLRLARSIELLCQFHAAYAQGLTLLPAEPSGSLTEMDVARVAAARRTIDRHWNRKLTIPALAKSCGLNRDKLTRGFVQIYGLTISQALSERRLEEARRMLIDSDLPVATIGYRCSYLNNAAFSRAFSRRFGVAPTAMRRIEMAA